MKFCRSAAVRILRLLGCNMLLLAAGLALVATVGEAWLRLTKPFMTAHYPALVFTPGVGWLLASHSVYRFTNQLDFWVVQRTNRYGFLDREPPSPDDIAQSCHVAIVGDSFVAGNQVPITDKLHVRLEELAAERIPGLNISSSAFGRDVTGQLAQLPLYDAFVQPLGPELVVLVFVLNDFVNNSPTLTAVAKGIDPDHPADQATARRDANCVLQLVPPNPKPQLLTSPRPASAALRSESWFAMWLNAKWNALVPTRMETFLRTNAEHLSHRPAYASVLDGWLPTTRRALKEQFTQAHLPPVFQDALVFTAFALDQFQERSERDGASLVVLASHTMGGRDNPAFERLAMQAKVRRIPLISQYDHILRQKGQPQDGNFRHDNHWNAKGHYWAAEALLEHLAQNPEACGSRAAHQESGRGARRKP